MGARLPQVDLGSTDAPRGLPADRWGTPLVLCLAGLTEALLALGTAATIRPEPTPSAALGGP